MSEISTVDRRAFMAYFSSIGLGSTLLPGVPWGQVTQQQASEISKEMIADAEGIASLSFSDEQRAGLAQGRRGLKSATQAL